MRSRGTDKDLHFRKPPNPHEKTTCERVLGVNRELGDANLHSIVPIVNSRCNCVQYLQREPGGAGRALHCSPPTHRSNFNAHRMLDFVFQVSTGIVC